MMPTSRKLPPEVEQVARRFLSGLLQVGTRAVAAAAKSASKDARKVVAEVESKLDTVIDGLSAYAGEDDPPQDDREIEVEVVTERPRQRKTAAHSVARKARP